MNKEINDKLDEIIEYIKNTESFKNYIKAKEILDNKDDIKKKIEEIKICQKKIVNDINKKDELERKIKDNLEYLQQDITSISYQEYLNEINNMII